eukprot:2329574-Prymnesium_polylepis.1
MGGADRRAPLGRDRAQPLAPPQVATEGRGRRGGDARPRGHGAREGAAPAQGDVLWRRGARGPGCDLARHRTGGGRGARRRGARRRGARRRRGRRRGGGRVHAGRPSRGCGGGGELGGRAG